MKKRDDYPIDFTRRELYGEEEEPDQADIDRRDQGRMQFDNPSMRGR